MKWLNLFILIMFEGCTASNAEGSVFSPPRPVCFHGRLGHPALIAFPPVILSCITIPDSCRSVVCAPLTMVYSQLENRTFVTSLELECLTQQIARWQ